MKRLLLIAVFLCVPVSMFAQVPPIPPTLPTPRVMPTPPTPPSPPTPPTPVAPAVISPMWLTNSGLFEYQHKVDLQHTLDQARWAVEESRLHFEDMKFSFDFDQDRVFSLQTGGRSAYDMGLSLMSQREYEKAITRFDQAIDLKEARADGAHYHKAYALFRLGRSAEATTTLSQLQKAYPQSRYLKDAKQLEAAVRQSGGQGARPETADDDEIKLLAINAIQQQDPERVLPILENLLNGANSLKIKEKAIFVLAQSSLPRARQILLDLAKGNGNPDLQKYAIRYFAANGKRSASAAELGEIYNAAQDDDVKRAILNAWGSTGNIPALVAVAGSNATTSIRTVALDQMSNAGATQELWAIYQKEPNRDLRMLILSRLGSLGATDRLLDVARSEKDAEIRRRALRSLGNMRSEKSGAALAELYHAEQDVDNKKAIISALAGQHNGEALVAIARKESNMTLKRTIVSHLSSMHDNKAAMDYMLEIIK